MGNDSVLVKFGEKRKGRRRGEKPERRNMGRSPGSYWGERVRVGWDLQHGVAQTSYVSLVITTKPSPICSTNF